MWFYEHPFEEGHQILVLRHGHRQEIPPGHFGHELPLTKEGEKASENLGKQLGKIRWGEIHSSPLIRCEQTANHFLKGAEQKTPIILSKILGDPGPFVSNPEEAGPFFLENTPQQILRKIASSQSIPGIRTLEEGGKLFITHLKTIKTFPCLMISHDIIIALLCSCFFKSQQLEPYVPDFLDGFCITIRSEMLKIDH